MTKKYFSLRLLSSRLLNLSGIILGLFGYRQPETRMIAHARRYWEDQSDLNFWKRVSHIRSSDSSQDESKWLTIGKEHFRIYEMFSSAVKFPRPPNRILEWGCGGGANAVHFAKECNEFIGVDVSPSAVEECKKQVETVSGTKFIPLVVPLDNPEFALTGLPYRCDLFISTYVFELLPSPRYGERILNIASQILIEGGMALIQIKYCESLRTAPKVFNYKRNSADMTTYRIEEFWKLAQQTGFTPALVHLVPKQPLVNDFRYAYFCLLNRKASQKEDRANNG